MNLNGLGNKDIKITGFNYDGDRTVVLNFEKVKQKDKDQKFTVTVTLGDNSVTSEEITVKAASTGSGDKTKKPDQNKNKTPKTGDQSPVLALSIVAVLALVVAFVARVFRRKKAD